MANKLNSKSMSAGTPRGDSYSTPPEFVEWLERKFVHTQFTLDPCATKQTAKAPMYFNRKQDGLKQSWAGHHVFCNPPHGKGQSMKWLSKAFHEVFVSTSVAKSAYVLLRADTSALWFQKYAPKASYVILPTPRISYLHPETLQPVKGNSIGAAVFVFDRMYRTRLAPKTLSNVECIFERWQ